MKITQFNTKIEDLEWENANMREEIKYSKNNWKKN